jgi:hypothetical protein
MDAEICGQPASEPIAPSTAVSPTSNVRSAFQPCVSVCRANSDMAGKTSTGSAAKISVATSRYSSTETVSLA